MILLQPEKINIKIRTTDMAVAYSERGGVTVDVAALSLDNFSADAYETYRISFDVVAELRCISLNFYEANHGEYEILDMCAPEQAETYWKEKGFHPDPGLYQFEDLDNVDTRMALYDPRKKLDLKKFLLIGNDAYVEVISKSYSIKKWNP
jgi:hypothetical protein